MKKLPRLPEYPTLDEVAEWLTEASDETWSPSAVLSRLLEWEAPTALPDGTLRQSRVATSREVWVVVPPDEVMTDQVDGAEVVTRGGQLVYVLEPIDLFVRTVLHCGEAVPNNGVSTQAGRRFRVTRSFSVRDVRIPKNDVSRLLPAFDQLMLELDRGEHSDLARLVDEARPGSEQRKSMNPLQPTGAEVGAETCSARPAKVRGSQGVSKREILAVFPPLKGQTPDQWEKMLGDLPKWLARARVDAGRRGIESRWNPAVFAMCLGEKGHMTRTALRTFIRRSFPEYLPEWDAYVDSFD